MAVALGERSYEIVIASDALRSVAAAIGRWREKRPWCAAAPGRALIVTDQNVSDPYATAVIKSLSDAGWSGELLELEPGEKSKTLTVVSAIYDHLVEMKADRQTVVVAVGGGVVGDTAGFAAASYARGLPFVQVPTSLLAQVDSAVGGKVGVNHSQGKNLIGAFYQPLGVFIDTETLTTLPERDYCSGLAEVVKYGISLDADFFRFLEENVAAIRDRRPDVLRSIVAQSCRLKAGIVEQDEQERTGIRSLLNYGHTFAHAFEALCGYGELMHGEAVAIGMVCAAKLAQRRRLIDAATSARQNALLEALALPTRLPPAVKLDTKDVLDRMLLDKKAADGRLHFVLPTRLGCAQLIDDVPEADVKAVLAEMA
ncbi:MAG: 3-dehydroquinate synthase [Planctomycetaceae bacterium]